MRCRITTRASAFAGALALFTAPLAACDPGTRIEGRITLEAALEAPDQARHTLYVGAFPGTEISGGVLSTSAVPAFIEFSGIENDDFDPSVEYALGGAGNAEPLHVVAWWKVNDGELPDYELPETGDRYGIHPENPVFEDETGRDGAVVRNVDVLLGRTFGIDTAFAPAAR